MAADSLGSSKNKKVGATTSSFIKNAYLILYNSACCVGWAIVLVLSLLHLLSTFGSNNVNPPTLSSLNQGLATLYEANNLAFILTYVQSAALLEIVHAVVQLVKNPAIFTAMQISSRIMAILALNFPPFAQAEWGSGVMILFLAMVEVPRYAFYVVEIVTGDANHSKNTSFVLFWLRYSLFAILYPTGFVVGELTISQRGPFDDDDKGVRRSSTSPAILLRKATSPSSVVETDNNDDEEPWEPPPVDDENKNDHDDGESFSSSSSSSAKCPKDEIKDEMNVDDEEFHANKGAANADQFYSGFHQSLCTRDVSPLFHMRAFNGWVTATQIQELDPKTMHILAGKQQQQQGKKGGLLRILDLACGKGGDLSRWAHHELGVSNYVGVDVARGSLKDAAIRARKLKRKLPKCTLTCADLGSDVPGRPRSTQTQHELQKLLSWSLQNERNHEDDDDPIFKMVPGGGISTSDTFDVVSIQFAIHYMFQERKRARRFFQTVSELLDVGGNLICTTIDARVVLDKLMNLGHNLHFFEDDENEEQQNRLGNKFTEATINVGNGACQIQFNADIVKRIFQFTEKTKLAKLNNDEPTMRFDDEDLFGLEYFFKLVEGSDDAYIVNLPEWLNPIPVLETLARDVGLELVSAENFHEFFDNRKDPAQHPTAHKALYNMKVLNQNGSISADNWDISRMYVAIQFKKVRDLGMNFNFNE